MNIETIRELAKILKDNNLSELTYQSGNQQLKLKQKLSQSTQSVSTNLSQDSPTQAEEPKTINATTIGTFYSSKSPDDPPLSRLATQSRWVTRLGLSRP